MGVEEALGIPGASDASDVTTTFTPPDQHPQLPLQIQATENTIARIAPVTDIQQAAKALATQPAWEISLHHHRFAEAKMAMAGADLALSIRVVDPHLQGGEHPWDGSEVEVYGNLPGTPTIGQVFLLPELEGKPAMAMHMDGGKPQPAADIKIASTTVDGGYETAGAHPMRFAGIRPGSHTYRAGNDGVRNPHHGNHGTLRLFIPLDRGV